MTVIVRLTFQFDGYIRGRLTVVRLFDHGTPRLAKDHLVEKYRDMMWLDVACKLK